MKNLLKLATAGLMAVSLAACSSSTTAEEEVVATAEATEEVEAAETHGAYTITNATGEKVTELYLYQTGSDDKGENYAADGLENEASVDVVIDVDQETADAGYAMTVEYTTESGDTENSFTSLHLETANFSLVKEADLSSSATQMNITFKAVEDVLADAE